MLGKIDTRSPISRPARRSMPRIWRRRRASWRGSPTITSPFSATAATTWSATRAAISCAGSRGSALGLLRRQGPGERDLAQLRRLATGDPPAGAGAAGDHQGECALDRASPGLSRLHRRAPLRCPRARWWASTASSACSPRPPTTATRPHPAAPPQGGARDRAREPAADRPLSARRWSTFSRPIRATSCSRPARSCSSRAGDPASAGAAEDPPVPRRATLRPVRLVPGLRAARALQHRDPAPLPGDPAGGAGRHRGRVPGPGLGIDPRPHPVHRAHGVPPVDADRGALAEAPVAGPTGRTRPDRRPWRGGGHRLFTPTAGDAGRLPGAGAGARGGATSTGSSSWRAARPIWPCRCTARSSMARACCA